MRSVLFVVGVLGIALSTRVSSGQPAGPDLATVSAEMTIVVQPQRVEITGAVSSAANEEMLRETAARVFPARTTVADLQQRIGLPPGWALVTDLTLQSLAETRSATATISPYQVTVRGFSEEGGGWRSAADRSRAYLPEGWVMNHQVEEIISGGSMNRQCVEVFRTALRGRKIEFQRDSAEIGTATMPLLDELIQIAVDCPASRIRITGHTDDSGSATDNLSLSRQRADAVAAYLVAGGIAIQRIKSEGVGSAQPLVAGNTAQARKLNRRIEIELQFP
jgi:OOP family OmpA-OmpF porin